MSDHPPDSSSPSSESGVALRAGGDIKVTGDVAGRDLSKIINNITNIFTSKRDSLERRNRRAMLEKVGNFWVKGVLEQSLHGAALIEMGMEYKLEAVQYPWATIFQRPDQPAQPLPPGTKTAEVFDQVSGELLILGAPGSGKTTMLLDLARDLIARAEQDETLLIPVVFNLSSWAEKRPPLAEWLVDELRFRYSVPKKIAEAWVKNDYVLPLLDGLDEVKLEYRTVCVEAINRFRQEHGLLPTVVCSRTADYEAINAKIQLHGAILLQSLTRKQIDTYLQNGGEQLASIRTLLQGDTELQWLAKSPLMLSIMALAYRETTIESLPKLTTIEAQRKHLFATYVQRMLKRRGIDKRYTQKQVIHWLCWLAQRMVDHAQTVFFLERMQPSWLQNKFQRRLYKLATGLVAGLVAGLLFGLVIGLSGGFFAGLIIGLMVMLMEEELKTVETLHWSGSDPLEEIRIVETLRWSWSDATVGLFFGLVIGLGIGLGVGLRIGPNVGLSIGLTFGLPIVLTVGLFHGLRISNEVETKTAPNQGVWRSAKNALLSGLFVGLIFWLASGLFSGLNDALIIGLIVGLLGALHYGGRACIQHFSLRFTLYRNGSMSLNYVRFLDYCAERIFLRKVGGGYIFVHRLLMEYFAGLEGEV